MITNLKINKLSVINGSCIFSDKDFKISSIIPNIERSRTRRDYWYKEQNTVIAPKTILFQGGFSSGKTLIYTLLNEIYEIVICGKRKDFSLEFDAEISFYYEHTSFCYHLILKGNRISDSLSSNDIPIKAQNATSDLVLSKETCLPAYLWFNNIIFVPSIYDNSDEYRNKIDQYSCEMNISKLLSSFKHEFQHQTNYSVKLESIKPLVKSKQFEQFLNTFISTNNILKTPFDKLNQSTIDLLLSIGFICFICKSKESVIIIDDIDLIAKIRFMSFIHDYFVARIAEKPIQLVAFSSRPHINYENRQLFAQAHKIDLDNLI